MKAPYTFVAISCCLVINLLKKVGIRVYPFRNSQALLCVHNTREHFPS